MTEQTIRDRCWLWGMRVNALQETDAFRALGFETSSLTVEEAVRRTGVHNVIMAGGLPIDAPSLRAMPSARRIVCKTSLHGHADGRTVMDYGACERVLLQAKELAAGDPRIEGFHVDDFSTGSIDAGARPTDLARLQCTNVTHPPHLPLSTTIYTMSLERPELPPLLPYFSHYLVPLWHADRIDTVPAALERLSELSGGKPMVLCLYCHDFGNGRPISGTLMQQHLDTAEELLIANRIAGLCLCGTCMMDLDWESSRCFYEWLEKVGDQAIPTTER